MQLNKGGVDPQWLRCLFLLGEGDRIDNWLNSDIKLSDAPPDKSYEFTVREPYFATI